MDAMCCFVSLFSNGISNKFFGIQPNLSSLRLLQPREVFSLLYPPIVCGVIFSAS